MEDKVICAICTAFIGGRNLASNSIKLACTTCKENFIIHLTCLKPLLAINQDASTYSNVLSDPSTLRYFRCSSCEENCHMCGAVHKLQDCNVELLKCSKSSLHHCYVIGSSKKKETGCLSKLNPLKRKIFDVRPYVCAICIEEARAAEGIVKKGVINKDNYHSTYDVQRLFSDKISNLYENQMLQIVRMCLVKAYVPREDMDAEQVKYSTMATIDDCHTEFKKTSVI